MWLLGWFESRLENVLFHGHSMRSLEYCYLKTGVTDSCLAWPYRNHPRTVWTPQISSFLADYHTAKYMLANFIVCAVNSQHSLHLVNTLNAKLNPICHLLALLGAHHILHVSRIRVKYGSVLHTYLLNLLTYSLTPWSRVLLEKLTGSQLVKIFPTFYGTRKFVTAFTSSRHLFLSRAS